MGQRGTPATTARSLCAGVSRPTFVNMEPVKPHGPDPTPTNPLEYNELPYNDDYLRRIIMKEKIAQWKSITVFRSRTIISLSVAILGLVFKFFGIDVDLGGAIEGADGLQVSEIITSVGLVLAFFFRKYLKTDLTTPGVGGAPDNSSNGG